MRKSVILSLFILLYIGSINAQSIYFGGKGTLANTWLLNKQVSESENQDYTPSLGYNYGLIAGFRFTTNFGLELNMLFNHHTQRYEGDNFESRTDLSTFDIPVLLRLGNNIYFETGPVFSFIKDADYEYEQGTLNTYSDVTNHFENTNICIAAGIGNDAAITKHLILNVVLRGVYGLTDIDGVNGLGLIKDLIISDEKEKFSNHTLAVSLSVGLKLQF